MTLSKSQNIASWILQIIVAVFGQEQGQHQTHWLLCAACAYDRLGHTAEAIQQLLAKRRHFGACVRKLRELYVGVAPWRRASALANSCCATDLSPLCSATSAIA